MRPRAGRSISSNGISPAHEGSALAPDAPGARSIFQPHLARGGWRRAGRGIGAARHLTPARSIHGVDRPRRFAGQGQHLQKRLAGCVILWRGAGPTGQQGHPLGRCQQGAKPSRIHPPGMRGPRPVMQRHAGRRGVQEQHQGQCPPAPGRPTAPAGPAAPPPPAAAPPPPARRSGLKTGIARTTQAPRPAPPARRPPAPPGQSPPAGSGRGKPPPAQHAA